MAPIRLLVDIHRPWLAITEEATAGKKPPPTPLIPRRAVWDWCLPGGRGSVVVWLHRPPPGAHALGSRMGVAERDVLFRVVKAAGDTKKNTCLLAWGKSMVLEGPHFFK